MRWLAAGLFVLLLEGCASSQLMQFEAVSTHQLPIAPSILKANVRGEDCSKGSGSYGNYALATTRAIVSVPTANALINAKFLRSDDFSRICVVVIGDAVRL
jgi:hypothetical protein